MVTRCPEPVSGLDGLGAVNVCVNHYLASLGYGGEFADDEMGVRAVDSRVPDRYRIGIDWAVFVAHSGFSTRAKMRRTAAFRPSFSGTLAMT
ncbi:hypothetical protein GCM10023063_15590 [Arthrobacter methylotrophus]